ncbi:hypothetical protein Hesp01_06330 [Herbidospora sp. NBRC 101105]|nr:hypothetical protein Hesp01_06330 [Herbidospora sp. NBRC 101105]
MIAAGPASAKPVNLGRTGHLPAIDQLSEATRPLPDHATSQTSEATRMLAHKETKQTNRRRDAHPPHHRAPKQHALREPSE